MAYHGLGYSLLFSGETEESIAYFDLAQKLSPHDHNVWAFLSIRAIALSQLGRHDEAIQLGREAVRKPHAKFWAHVNLLSALGHTERAAEAEDILRQLLALRPDVNIDFVKYAMDYYQDEKKLEYYLDGLRNSGLPEG